MLKINQLLFHPKSQCLSFFLSALQETTLIDHQNFLADILVQLGLQGKKSLAQRYEPLIADVLRISQRHPERSYGFFVSDQVSGYMILESSVETYCTIASSFHMRPILQEVFINPEYMILNISKFEVRLYQGDLNQVEYIRSFEFAKEESACLPWEQARYVTGDLSQLIPHRTFSNLRNVANKIMETMPIGSMPVLITGNETLKNIFQRYYSHAYGSIDITEDYEEASCIDIMCSMKKYRQNILDFYSNLFKAKILKVINAGLLLSDLGLVIRAVQQGELSSVMIPTGKNLWGTVNFKTGKFSIGPEADMDILNEIAEEVVRQGGKVHYLSSHFFPKDSFVMGVLKKGRKSAA